MRPSAAVLLAVVALLLVIWLATRVRSHQISPAEAASDAAAAAPRERPITRRHASAGRAPPQMAAVPPRPASIDWRSPGLCEDGTDAALTRRRRDALLQTFRKDDVNGVLVAHDEGVPADTLEAIRFALGRTRQFADYLLGWSPKDFPPPIYVYRNVEQLRSVACINGTNIAYYDGNIHLTGDPRYTTATLTEESAHEYVHHILATMGVSRPIWLHEGLAMQVAGERWWKKPELGLWAWLQREHLPFDALVDDFPHAARDERRATAAYYQSYMMVGFIRRRRPASYVRELLDDLAWGRLTAEEAFPAAAAVPPGSTLEVEWERYVRTHRDF